MNIQTKLFAFLIVIAVIAYTVFDLFQATRAKQQVALEKCSEEFRREAAVSKTEARAYCSCALEKYGDAYFDTRISGEQVRFDEKEVLEECFRVARGE